jgi:hypothetical protein
MKYWVSTGNGILKRISKSRTALSGLYYNGTCENYNLKESIAISIKSFTGYGKKPKK